MGFLDYAAPLSDIVFSIFKETASLLTGTGESIELEGIFTDKTEGGNLMDGGSPEGPAVQAVFELIYNSDADIEVGSFLLARGRQWQVIDKAFDACGNIQLYLHR